MTSPIPINDPWYSAHQTVPGYSLNFTGWGNLSVGAYFADQTASVLGCAKQYQICHPGNPPRCSRWGGKQELWWLLKSVVQNEKQLNRTKWAIMSALTGNELDGFVQTLGAASLSSKSSLVSGVQGPLPDNQWQLDVEHWHAATLVAMQGSAVDAAMGPSSKEMKQFWPGPNNEQERSVCRNQVCITSLTGSGDQLTRQQKIFSDAHANFSVFGLAFTFAVGGIIIVISCILETSPNFVLKLFKSNRHAYSQLEWCANGTLQLQRLAHEELGLGTWTECTSDVPMTEKGEMLGVLAITDPSRPRLTVSETETAVSHDARTNLIETGADRGRKSKNSSVEMVQRMETGLSSTSTAV